MLQYAWDLVLLLYRVHNSIGLCIAPEDCQKMHVCCCTTLLHGTLQLAPCPHNSHLCPPDAHGPVMAAARIRGGVPGYKGDTCHTPCVALAHSAHCKATAGDPGEKAAEHVATCVTVARDSSAQGAAAKQES
jgi:hypothetical protein